MSERSEKEFRPGVYRFKHKVAAEQRFATAVLSSEPGYVRFDWPDGHWDQWPLDWWQNDWEWWST